MSYLKKLYKEQLIDLSEKKALLDKIPKKSLDEKQKSDIDFLQFKIDYLKEQLRFF